MKMKFINSWPAMKWPLLGLLVLVSTFSSSTQTTVGEFKTERLAKAQNAELECYACNSINGGCEIHKNNEGKVNPSFEKSQVKCNDATNDGYLAEVYGNKALAEDSMDLNEWPPSLTEIAEKHSKSSDVTPGWAYGSFPSAFEPPRSSSSSSVKFSSIASLSDKGYVSCRKMRIWVDEQKNDGKTHEIPKTRPRIIRTCSLVAKPSGFNEKGCKIFTMKTVNVEVCYCDKNLCNGASYLRVSQFWILAASLLVFVGKLGMN